MFSTDPVSYPTGGRKALRDTPFDADVLERGLPVIGTGPADIRRYFADHERILALGLDTSMNVPVRVAGRTVGVVNMLRGGAPYRAHDVVPMRGVAGLLAAPLATAV